jgi:hypothetical protein
VLRVSLFRNITLVLQSPITQHHFTTKMSHWKDRAQQKRLLQASTIPKEWHLPSLLDFTSAAAYIDNCSLLTPAEQAITSNTDAHRLQEQLQSGALTAEEVATAFAKRAALAQQLTGCCTEMFFDRAIDRARELDRRFAEGGPVGPLHGFPISFKDNFLVEGIDTTIGEFAVYLIFYRDIRVVFGSARTSVDCVQAGWDLLGSQQRETVLEWRLL